jgi:hypothetical protein
MNLRCCTCSFELAFVVWDVGFYAILCDSSNCSKCSRMKQFIPLTLIFNRASKIRLSVCNSQELFAQDPSSPALTCVDVALTLSQRMDILWQR